VSKKQHFNFWTKSIGPCNIHTLYLRCLYCVFYTYDELYYEDFTSATSIGVNSYWTQGLKPPTDDHGARLYDEPPTHFCDVILCFNCSQWFYAMPTNRQLDHSFPAVLDIFRKGLNLPAPLDIQWSKCFRLPEPLTRGSAPGPRWGSAPRPPL